MRTPRQETGARAEEAAARFLEGLGLSILERNFRGRCGELDLVARDGEAVVFVEVRARSSAAYGLPQETVDRRKRRRLLKTALLYASARGLDCPMRFDVVAVSGERLEHFPGAFGAEG